jgi:hypothetical protein
MRAFDRPPTPEGSGGRRERRKTVIASVLTALATEPDGPSQLLSGRELARTVPSDADGILFVPRSSLLTVDGAAFLHQRPELARREWLEQQHQRYTRAASRRFNLR